MKNKLISFALFILFLIPSATFAQTGIVSLDHVDGLISGDTVALDVDLTFYIRFNNNTGDTIVGSTNGFRIYSPDGAVWAPLTVNYDSALLKEYGPNVYISIFSDGSISDTVGFGGIQIDSSESGIIDGYDEVVFSITTSVDGSQQGKTICIDSAFYPPVSSWGWTNFANDVIDPEWDGPHCFVIQQLTTGIAEDNRGIIPEKLTLLQNYPNPFNPRTNISFLLPEKSTYQLLIYNSLGRQIEDFSGTHSAGFVEISWDASPYASGIYFYKLITGKEALTKKMILLK